MQIFLHADHCTRRSQPVSDHLSDAVNDAVNNALGRFGQRVTRVEAYLSDADDNARTSAWDIHCTLHASVVGADTVIVKDQARSAHRAMQGALRKLKRAVGAAVAQQDPRRPSSSRGAPARERAATVSHQVSEPRHG